MTILVQTALYGYLRRFFFTHVSIVGNGINALLRVSALANCKRQCCILRGGYKAGITILVVGQLAALCSQLIVYKSVRIIKGRGTAFTLIAFHQIDRKSDCACSCNRFHSNSCFVLLRLVFRIRIEDIKVNTVVELDSKRKVFLGASPFEVQRYDAFLLAAVICCDCELHFLASRQYIERFIAAYLYDLLAGGGNAVVAESNQLAAYCIPLGTSVLLRQLYTFRQSIYDCPIKFRRTLLNLFVISALDSYYLVLTLTCGCNINGPDTLHHVDGNGRAGLIHLMTCRLVSSRFYGNGVFAKPCILWHIRNYNLSKRILSNF